MKKNIVALAVASAIAAPVAMADAPTVYGKVNMAFDQISKDDANGNEVNADSGSQINSRASRMGVKGSSDLGNGMKAVYKFEFQVQPDQGDTLKNRNQYVGLAGGFGTVLMGRHDTPTKMSQPKDLFNDSPYADFGKGFGGGLGALGKAGEIRSSNVLAYVSPSFGGVKLVGALAPKETSGDTTENSSISDFYSLALMYGSKKEGLYLSAAMDRASASYTGHGESTSYDIADGTDLLGVDANGNDVYDPASVTPNVTEAGEGDDVTHIRVSAQYKMAGLTANAMYQDFSGDGIEDSIQEGNNIQANVGYKVGNFMPKAKVSMIDYGNDDLEDATNYAVGVNYSLGKKTTTYAEYVMNENQNGTEDAETSAFSVGLVHKF